MDLYVEPPGSFVSARNARAAEIGDNDLAAQVRALRKPSAAAWVVNLFARERSGELGEALQLAEELREAQDDLDAPTLAKLGRERRALTTRLAEQAAALADARGERISASTREAVRQTLTAAFFDRDAAAAVASGRLVRSLEPSGADHVDLSDAVGGGRADAPAAAERPVDEVGERRERRRAEREVREADRDLAQAERDAAAAERSAVKAAQRADLLASRISELENELSRLRAQADAARVELSRAEDSHTEVAEQLRKAQSAAEAAHRALDQLGN